jgi:hypothetical protein
VSAGAISDDEPVVMLTFAAPRFVRAGGLRLAYEEVAPPDYEGVGHIPRSRSTSGSTRT